MTEIITNFQAIFNDTWDFYGDLIWRLNDLLLGKRRHGDEQTYRYYYETSLRSKCQKFEASLGGDKDQGDVAIRVSRVSLACERIAAERRARLNMCHSLHVSICAPLVNCWLDGPKLREPAPEHFIAFTKQTTCSAAGIQRWNY